MNITNTCVCILCIASQHPVTNEAPGTCIAYRNSMRTDGPRENATERRIHQSGSEPEYQKGTTCKWTEVRNKHAQHLSYVAARVSD
jgi:hypothetical protein